MPMTAWALTVLPGAGLADDGEGLAPVEVVAHAVDRLDDTLPGAELDAEILDFEKSLGRHRAACRGGGRRHRQRSLGSRASRSASPMRMKEKTVTERNAAGKRRRWGAWMIRV